MALEAVLAWAAAHVLSGQCDAGSSAGSECADPLGSAENPGKMEAGREAEGVLRQAGPDLEGLFGAVYSVLRAGLGVFCRHCLSGSFDFSAYPPLGGSVAVNPIFAYKENNEWILNIGIYRAYFW